MLKNRQVISKNSRLQTDSIDIWAADVDCLEVEIQHYAGLLSDEESARSAKFRATRHRKGYIVRHGILRELLSAYLSCRPSELKIFTDSKGKPYVVDSVLETPLQFSMSHSAGLAVFAFSRSAAIGVDIERIFGFPELGEIASQHFTPAEIKEVDCCPESNRVEVFFKLWARKEAVLKANCRFSQNRGSMPKNNPSQSAVVRLPGASGSLKFLMSAVAIAADMPSRKGPWSNWTAVNILLL